MRKAPCPKKVSGYYSRLGMVKWSPRKIRLLGIESHWAN